MVRLVLPNIYKIEIPLPNNPLKAINCFVVKGEKRNLVIDTGMNRTECYEAIMAGFEQIDVNLAETDFFVTHYHIDHCGLVSSLLKPECKVYTSKSDGEIINRTSGPAHEETLILLQNYAAAHGFPPLLLNEAIYNHPGHLYKPEHQIEITPVKEGDIIKAGGYNFQCLFTPGHTNGHVCLYEKERKILFSGDHVLGHITPNVSQFSDDDNVLTKYLSSLDKVAGLEVDIVLPAHHGGFTNCQERIRQLKEHHFVRIEEVFNIVRGNTLINAYEAAARMTWEMKGKWVDFKVQQKWFACGEAIAHLEYLHGQGRLTRLLDHNGRIIWRTPK